MPRRAVLALLATLVAALSACQAQVPLPPAPRPVPGKPGILAVFAHPDDETTVGALLAHYAALGHPVHLATLTSGGKGTRLHAGIPAGPALERAREAELTCAAQALGLPPPIPLRFEDARLSDWAV